jgi:hypothetical protein
MRRFLALSTVFLFSCAPKDQPEEKRVDNTVTRYTGSLVTSTEKAKANVEKANQAIAASQAAAALAAQDTP